MESNVQAPRERKPKPSFRKEIVITLLVKLALLMLVKYMFFDHPVDKATVAARVDSVFSNTTFPPSTPALPTAKDTP